MGFLDNLTKDVKALGDEIKQGADDLRKKTDEIIKEETKREPDEVRPDGTEVYQVDRPDFKGTIERSHSVSPGADCTTHWLDDNKGRLTEMMNQLAKGEISGQDLRNALDQNPCMDPGSPKPPGMGN